MKTFLLIFGLVGFSNVPGVQGQTPEPVVHAVFFYSPTCAHCHQLIAEYLVPLQERYGRSLVLLAMDTSQPWANNLYWETIRHFELPEEDWAVPMMVLGQEVLIGGIDIPNRLTAALEEGLAGDGLDLPNYPTLVNFLREQDALDPRYPDRLIARVPPGQEEPAAADEPHTDEPATDESAGEEPVVVEAEAGEAEGVDSVSVAVEEENISVGDSAAVAPPTEAVEVVTSEVEDVGPPVEDTPSREDVDETPPDVGVEAGPAPSEGAMASLDLVEAAREMESMTMLDRFNLDRAGNSLSVLVLLVMIVSLALRGYLPGSRGGEWPSWVIPALVVVGTGVAAYLSFIEVTHAEAVCGPVGDCNTVNQSKYAYIFGFLPVGVLGLMGYGLILALWFLSRLGSEALATRATIGLWGSTVFGTLFSVYLTFLEPFVIGATCAWCLTSAVVMTLLLWASAPPAAKAWRGDGMPASSD